MSAIGWFGTGLLVLTWLVVASTLGIEGYLWVANGRRFTRLLAIYGTLTLLMFIYATTMIIVLVFERPGLGW